MRLIETGLMLLFFHCWIWVFLSLLAISEFFQFCVRDKLSEVLYVLVGGFEFLLKQPVFGL